MVLAARPEAMRIRRLRADDIPILKRWDTDPEIHDLTGKKFNESGEEWWESLSRGRNRMGFAILNNQGELIGDVELEHIAWRTREAEVRISIGDKRYWGVGFGTEALREVLHMAFYRLLLGRVYLRVREDNRRALKSYGKVGFKKIGRLGGSGRLRGCGALILMEIDRKAYELAKAACAGSNWTPVR